MTTEQSRDDTRREIINRVGILGRLRIIHNTNTNSYAMISEGLFHSQFIGFSSEEFDFILDKLVHYRENRRKSQENASE